MNIGFRVYFTYLCTNQSVECDISGISKDRKFSCPKLGCRTGENWEKNFPNKYYEDTGSNSHLWVLCSRIFTAV